MSEELENQVDEAVEPEVEETNPEMDKARAAGWRPKDEWEGDPDDWVSYKRFNEKGEMISSIRQLRKALQDQKGAIDQLVDHNKKLEAKRTKEMQDYIKKQKAQAITDGDADRVLELDEMMEQAKEQERTIQSQPPQNNPSPVFTEWTERNPWYENDPDLREEADLIGQAMFQNKMGNGPLSHDDVRKVLDKVTDKVKRMYPEKFENPNKSKPGAVSSSSTTTSSSKPKGKKFSIAKDVPENMQHAVKKMVTLTGMEEHEYIKQMKELGEL